MAEKQFVDIFKGREALACGFIARVFAHYSYSAILA
jgi:hypothetical protein